MCKIVAYVVTDVMLVISLSLIWYNNYQFYYHFYIDTESKTPYHLTNCIHLPANFPSSLSGSIVRPTHTVIQGKWAQLIKLICCSCYVFLNNAVSNNVHSHQLQKDNYHKFMN